MTKAEAEKKEKEGRAQTRPRPALRLCDEIVSNFLFIFIFFEAFSSVRRNGTLDEYIIYDNARYIWHTILD